MTEPLEVAVHVEKPKHPGGRPSEYDPSFVQATLQYLKTYQERGEVVPTIEGLCRILGKSKQTLMDYEKKYPEFLDATSQLRAEQGFQLQNKGLANQTNPAITKLMLSANHGMREKNDLEVSGKDGQPIDSSITVHIKHV